MKTYQYLEPDNEGNPITITRTEEEILFEYFYYWSFKMIKADKADKITTQNCIKDWIVLHWAEELL